MNTPKLGPAGKVVGVALAVGLLSMVMDLVQGRDPFSARALSSDMLTTFFGAFGTGIYLGLKNK